ncbi:asparagine synthase (glutamine-hydrolyzing) [Acetatifactor muris]|uniref:asparagine synthase (glutamine-hydrolyzing) n=1 Tax=Acetatifactor muris TaxID=879566 RepID=A0A2K4ZHH7_9FIRM|nr:asparagine synthase (glutamine-hydrolyzing) [Acetatifactor muris]MCI8798820.1 asparagine synthase (glutamine-hydrolyzing) [Lachnospiraceae bacterium]MCR2048005.1 asparagine synthase (glutamine-hydrolyzing) [Acetatifactor muris]SOY29920.1 Asparagine synthetase [glutamine-hydrolyzing] 1 [Acetatifactor muris]
MCGICGFTEKITKNETGPRQTRQEREKILEAMMAALVHRGPDQGNSWLSEKVALGFRRLSIIDPAGSVQPMANETGSLILVFNGEIYNYQELRQELFKAGHRFSTQGDSEVLLHGYEEWGEHLPDHLRGMFAFAIWDESRQTLYAARDPFGIKPFYYALADGALLFASEIKGILPHPSYKKKLNPEALEQYLSFQYSALEKTFFQGIWQLLPGHFLKYDQNSSALTVEQYFVPTLYPDNPPKRLNRTEEEWIAELDKVIADSVKHHMAADTEIGTFLSGGVDSSLIAAEFTGDRAFTVGLGSDTGHYNEIPLATELAEKLGLKHRGKRISEREFWEAVPEVLYHMDEPNGDPSAVALYFLSREAARQVKVVVSGEGADELFGGYCIYCEPNALHLYQKLPSSLRKGIAQLVSRLPKMKGRSFLIRGSMPVEQRFIGNANLFTADERKRLLKNPTRTPSPQELLADDYQEAQNLDEASRMQYIDLLHWLPGDILQKADRMSMAHSLELRVPYLDREVFEVARRLPAKYKQKGQISKYLFRKVAGRHLPAVTSNRRKLGFPIPLGHFLTSESGSKAVIQAFSSPTAEKFFNREALDELLEGRGSGRGNTNRKIWAVYSFLVWYDIYFHEQPKTVFEEK